MSGQLRALKNRIRSVENTKKITYAMEMVAAAKLHRFQDMMQKSRPYGDGLETLMRRLVTQQGPSRLPHPFFETRKEKKIAVILMTSDTGLCGSYNSDLVDKALRFIQAQENPPLLVGVGNYGISALKRRGMIFAHTMTHIRINVLEETLQKMQTLLEDLYLQKTVDSIYVVYSHFLTGSSYQSVIEKLLPLEGNFETDPRASHSQKSPEKIATGGWEDYIFEPSEDFIFQKLVPAYFETKLRMIFLESFVSEQIARMNAMHQATENAEELRETLVLQRNKARQAAITKEIIEIITGSQALHKQ